MNKPYKYNTHVEWSWGQGKAQGYIRKKFNKTVTKTIKDNEVTRNGTDDDPAYLIEQPDGDQVLKLHSELEKTG